jgi:hypothetical protein
MRSIVSAGRRDVTPAGPETPGQSVTTLYWIINRQTLATHLIHRKDYFLSA